ncbi:RING-H2 finger protein ATL22 [Gossypium australe]|uniref:RING-type E3 ubiquitin transferase n=1 Tax=Gossypium australe TaxID=47621 RepID=A0A5B6UIJ4_9ROSI|nr:RING-H2 finger protein ATL22 [Gossypium australe]
MALFQIFFFVVFSFIFPSVQSSTSTEICPVFCGDKLIRLPFRLSNQPDRCGYPRFNLTCKNQTKTILTLPFFGELIVENIDYLYQSIWINDPDYCIPRRFFKGLNLSGTPFEAQDLESYVFLNWSNGAIPKQLPQVRYISCLSGETFSVIAIPANRPDEYRSLSWTCMNIGIPRSAIFGISFGVGIFLICFLRLICHLQRKANNIYNDYQHHILEISGPAVVRPRSATDDAKGLDGPSIEAYPITLLGESRRLLRPSDNTCSICLCEYQANEKLRTIPDCKHYFHAICIDEWLKLIAACPICRNTPQTYTPAA